MEHAQDAALDRIAFGRPGRRHQRLAQDLARHRIGRAGGDAQQGHRPQEVAAVALALGQLLPRELDERMDPLLPIRHGHPPCCPTRARALYRQAAATRRSTGACDEKPSRASHAP